jgi:hypothetical protein
MSAYPKITGKIPEYSGVNRRIFEEDIIPAGKPALLRGIAAHWPSVCAAAHSVRALGNYLKHLDSGAQVDTFFGPPSMKGRYFYNDRLDGFNFEQGKATLTSIVDQLLRHGSGPPGVMIYAGSTPANDAVPEFMNDNPMPLIDADVEPRLWLGNASRVAAHYDNSRNIACCVSGTRRFTLFPPGQIGNLYLGPLEFTMAGPPASMVDFHNPDYERFPRFRDAERAGMIGQLEPGDAIYMPALWWHHVEADGPFNLLVNYWWMAPNAGTVFESVLLALINLRDQPEPDKQAWRAFFDHYVFGEGAADVSDHLPDHWQTVTGNKSKERDAMVMQFIMGRLSRV